MDKPLSLVFASKLILSVWFLFYTIYSDNGEMVSLFIHLAIYLLEELLEAKAETWQAEFYTSDPTIFVVINTKLLFWGI